MYRSLAPPAVITVRVYKNCDQLDERELEYSKPHLLAVYFCELFFHAIDVYFNSISANIYIDLSVMISIIRICLNLDCLHWNSKHLVSQSEESPIGDGHILDAR